MLRLARIAAVSILVSAVIAPIQAQTSSTGAVVAVSVESNANPAVYAVPITLTITVSAPQASVAAKPVPSGTVTALVQGPYTLGAAVLDGAGRGVISIPQTPGVLASPGYGLTGGDNEITIVYSGDTHYDARKTTYTQWITKANTSTAASYSGGAVSATVAINESRVTSLQFVLPGAGAAPSGTVKFFDGATLLGTATLTTSSFLTSVASLSVPSAPVALVAVYSGDTNYNASQSPGSSTTGAATAAVTVTSSANPALFTQMVTLNIAVTPSTAGPAPTGAVTASVLGLFVLGVATLDSTGHASILVPSTIGMTAKLPWGFGAGANSVTVAYAGDLRYAPAKTTFTQTVTKAPSATNAEILPTASVGTTIRATVFLMTPFNALVPFEIPGDTPGTVNPSGSVQFLRGGVPVGTATLTANGSFQATAILTVTALPTSTGDIVAVYSGDANYNGSTSPPASLPGTTATSLTVKSNANPSTFAQPVTMSVTVAPATAGGPAPSGTVTATVLGSYTLASGSLDSNGQITLTIPQDPGALTVLPWGLGAGANAINVSYAGDRNYSGSKTTFNQVVNKAGTSTNISLPPVAVGAMFFPILVRVGIDEKSVTKIDFALPGGSPASDCPTGSVAFYNGAILLGTVTLAPAGNFQSSATLTLATVPQSIRAVYYGDVDYNGSSSPSTSPGGGAVTISLASSSNPAVYGAAFTIMATLAPATASGPTPTGTVSFYEGSRNLGWVAGVDATGHASMPIPEPLASPAICPCPSAAQVAVLGAGTHTITASYSGDANYAPATSTTSLSQQITKAPTTTALEYASTGVFPAVSLHLVADVADSQPPSAGPYRFMLITPSGLTDGNPTGGVQFLGNGTVIGKATLSPSPTNNVTSNGSIDTISQMTSFAAVYPGDANFSGSSSPETAITPTAITLTSSPNPSVIGQSVTLTATITTTVAVSNANPVIPGTVDFFDGAALLKRVAVTGQVATLTATFATAGSHSLSATYNGGGYYQPSTSPTLTQTVIPSGTVETLTLTALPTTGVYGQQIALTATAQGNGFVPPLGIVTFYEGTMVLGAASLSTGSAHLTVTLPVGVHQITASWPSDIGGSAVQSGGIAITVNKAATVTVLSSGLVAAVTAVAPGAGMPTGNVQLVNSSGAVLSTAALVNGSAHFNTLSDPISAAAALKAVYAGDANFTPSTSNTLPVIVNPGNTPTQTLAPDEIATVYGTALAAGMAVGGSPLQTTLAGANVVVQDSAGGSRLAALYYASPSQINFVVPSDAASGPATVTVGATTLAVTIAPVAPSLYSASQIVRVHGDGSQSTETVLTGSITFGSDSLYMVLYASGLRHRSSLDNVRCNIGGTSLPVTYAGAQSQFPGLDQVVLALPASLKGAGPLNVSVTVDGQTSNVLSLTFYE